MTIKDLVKDNKKVRFQYFREGNFYYTTECGFLFPVPLDDIGTATLLAQDRAILFMRYIRKHIETITSGLSKLGVKFNLEDHIKSLASKHESI